MFNQKQASVISTNTPNHQTTAEGLSTTQTTPTPQHTASLTNQEFYVMCVHTGKTAKTAVREFLALLPEAEERQIYLEHGMNSIFEFAAKLGGVSREQVLLTLRLDQRFTDLPKLKHALISGQVPVHQLARVASVVTPENQEFWLTQSKLLSKGALETLVRDTKAVPRHVSNPNKTGKTRKIPQSDQLQLNPEITERLLTLQNKGLDLNQLLGEWLDQREESIQQEKQEIARELEQKQTGNQLKALKSRYIPKQIRNIVKNEHGEKCAQEHCLNKSTTIHHTRRYALNSNHNPLYLAPLCKSHHEIAHTIDVKVVEKRSAPFQ